MNRTAGRQGNGYALSRDLSSRLEPVDSLQRPVGREARKHPPHQVRKIGASLLRFGFVYPILVDQERRVVAGWALVLAARELGLKDVPVVSLTDLPVLELRRLRLALNRTSEDASWDKQELAIEIAEILTAEPEADPLITGFETAELDVLLDDVGTDQEDVVPVREDGSEPISRVGDLWKLDQHRIFCGDAENPDAYRHLLGSEKPEMRFADPPYNVPVEGHVSGLGAVKHRNFARASGEMSPEEFTRFLEITLGYAARHSKNGAVHFVCMDWRHLQEILTAGTAVYWKLLNLCVWKKSNAGMGSHYRSQHELIFMFQAGKGPHIKTRSTS